eukprot:gnl/MRDRNA2_/MRDRNA2_106170_c0_seq1.p1 gnl/MRDRNA2_/MRDRNA2_106170_c0~~gnl/MRDRNA2_/MRDRNA2_106170_c0_seq1.p1  ORF type:complete len:643 (-),score=91.53 gnl/MRDRNA2_/MRDRNA2_106170_c0_seq1:256-1935(-)
MSAMRMQLLFGSADAERGPWQQEGSKASNSCGDYDAASCSNVSNVSALERDEVASVTSDFSTLSAASGFSLMSHGSAWADIVGETTAHRRWTAPAHPKDTSKPSKEGKGLSRRKDQDIPNYNQFVSSQTKKDTKQLDQGVVRTKKDKFERDLQKLQTQLQQSLHEHLETWSQLLEQSSVHTQPNLPEKACCAVAPIKEKVLLPQSCWSGVAHLILSCLPPWLHNDQSVVGDEQLEFQIHQADNLKKNVTENVELVKHEKQKLKTGDSPGSQWSKYNDPWGIRFLSPVISSLGSSRWPADVACPECSDVEAYLEILRVNRSVHIVLPALFGLVTLIEDGLKLDQIAAFQRHKGATRVLIAAEGSTFIVQLLACVVLFSLVLRNVQFTYLLGGDTGLQMMKLLLDCMSDKSSVDQRTCAIAKMCFTLMFHGFSVSVQNKQLLPETSLNTTLAKSILKSFKEADCPFLRSAILLFVANLVVQGGRSACHSFVCAGVVPRVSTFSLRSRDGTSEEPVQLLLLSILVARSKLARQQLEALILALPCDGRLQLELKSCLLPSSFA